MLQRIDLDQDQVSQLLQALKSDQPDVFMLENTVNLAALVGFLGSRYLPLPPLRSHGTIDGEGRVFDVMLARTSDAYVLLEQSRRTDEAPGDPRTVSAFVVLRSSLPFAPEERKEGWPGRIRACLLDIVQWTLEQGRPGASQPDAHLEMPAWRALLGESPTVPGFIRPDQDEVRRVIRGEKTSQQAWFQWLSDAEGARNDFEECMFGRNVMKNIVSMSSPRSIP